MTEIHRLMATLKRQLKLRGITYAQVANALQLSEPTVKRWFSTGNLTVERLTQLAGLLDMSLAELMRECEAGQPMLAQLTLSQEQELVADIRFLLVAICVLNHWSLQDIVSKYRFTEAQCLRHLVALDRMRLIELLPGNRLRLLVARNFEWIAEGPIRLFFRQQALDDFVDSPFSNAAETLSFSHGMLTAQAGAHLQKKLKRLQREFAELHEESLNQPFEQRHGTGLLVALREWEPKGFENLKR
jgi:transcriptional regulator with XRE-family HTH domain